MSLPIERLKECIKDSWQLNIPVDYSFKEHPQYQQALQELQEAAEAAQQDQQIPATISGVSPQVWPPADIQVSSADVAAKEVDPFDPDYDALVSPATTSTDPYPKFPE